jgi:putative acetyltransferase
MAAQAAQQEAAAGLQNSPTGHSFLFTGICWRRSRYCLGQDRLKLADSTSTCGSCIKSGGIHVEGIFNWKLLAGSRASERSGEERPETAADAAAIEAATISAFLNAPHTSHTEHLIVTALGSAGLVTIPLVADAEDTLIGHVAVSPVSISDGAKGWFGVGPVSGVPDHQLCGVGSRLMRDALGILRQQGAAGSVLLGEPKYYSRFGFQVDPNLTLPDVPPDYFLAISLDSSRPRGTGTYHESFTAPKHP